MDRLELLINQARLETDNTEFSEGAGIQDAEFIHGANSAQERLQSLIIKEHGTAFEEEYIFPMVAGTDEYSMPPLAYLGFRLEKVEYSESGQARNYRTLRKRTLLEREVGPQGFPSGYIKRNKTLVITPVPQSGGTVRVTFTKVLPKLDIRRGQVLEVTLNTTDSQITNLKLDPSISLDGATLESKAYLTVVDKDGVIKMAGVPVVSVNLTDGTVVLDTFTYASGETIEIGDYVVAGKYATTHCELPDTCEKYLIAYMCWKILKRDSSNDSQEQTAELQGMEQEVVQSFQEDGMDVDFVPLISGQYLCQDEWGW